MKHALSIIFFTVFVTGMYCYVGQLVPQKEVYPPKSAEVRVDMSTTEMVDAGRTIVEGKGTCLTCHNTSARFPNLNGVGERAKSRRQGYSDLDYLAESLYEPGAYIVETFAPGMPPVNKPPINLSDQEILCVLAYLQTLGGTASVSMQTKLKYQGSAGAAAPAAAEGGAGEDKLDGKGLVAKYGCMACHSFDAPVRLVGPSLYDAGKRLTPPEIYESIMNPDAKITEGFPPAVMGATLNGTGFFDKANPKQVKLIVEYLSSLKG